MPYIKDEDRQFIVRQARALANVVDTEGELNFAITTLIDTMLDHKEWALRYVSLNSIIGVLESVKLEFYRRVVVPYENQKAVDNGDVYHDAHLIRGYPHLPGDE